MHAVVLRVTLDDPDAAVDALHNSVVPTVKEAPGFVAGYWTRSADGGNGLSMVVFDSEENATAASERVREGAPDSVTIEDVEVREVVANA